MFLDADQDTYSRKRAYAFQTIAELLEGRTDASVVVTLDEQSIADAALLNPEGSGTPPMTILSGPTALPVCGEPVSLLDSRGNGQDPAEGSREFQSLRHRQRAMAPDQPDPAVAPRHSFAIRGDRAGRQRKSSGCQLGTGDAPDRLRFPGPNRMDPADPSAPLARGNLLYDVLDEVRGKREISLDSVRALALETKIVGPSEDDGLRFAYPGFQSYWCAQYLIEQGPLSATTWMISPLPSAAAAGSSFGRILWCCSPE